VKYSIFNDSKGIRFPRYTSHDSWSQMNGIRSCNVNFIFLSERIFSVINTCNVISTIAHVAYNCHVSGHRLHFLREKGKITNKDYRKLTDISDEGARIDLKELPLICTMELSK